MMNNYHILVVEDEKNIRSFMQTILTSNGYAVLTAKTGDVIVREPMEPEKNRVLVEMELSGAPDQVDIKFGQLLWLSDHLLSKGMAHELRVLTGDGIQCIQVQTPEDLEEALDTLLAQPMVPQERRMEAVTAAWCYRIGGGHDAS